MNFVWHFFFFSLLDTKYVHTSSKCVFLLRQGQLYQTVTCTHKSACIIDAFMFVCVCILNNIFIWLGLNTVHWISSLWSLFFSEKWEFRVGWGCLFFLFFLSYYHTNIKCINMWMDKVCDDWPSLSL